MSEVIMTGKGIDPNECRFLDVRHEGKLTYYNLYFESISAVELFLRDNPPRNTEVFATMSSESADESFAGPPLEEAIRYCVGGYDENYPLFLELGERLQSVNTVKTEVRAVEPAVVGHRPNVPAYIAGAPKCMYRNKRIEEKKVINVFMQATYSQGTTEKQILHRGILALNLIKRLEMNGYIVQFRLFETSVLYNEAFICEVALKNQAEKLDARKCFYPMCGKGFVRRVLLRIKESMPFKEKWYPSYGTVAGERIARQFLNISPNDIYIGTPKEIGIKGKDIYADANTFLTNLMLDGQIKVPQY